MFCNLQELIIMNRVRTEVSVVPLKSLNQLKKLIVNNCIISDISNLSTLINIEEFRIKFNCNLNISVMQFWTNLKKLTISCIDAKNISVLRNLIYLEELNCSNNDNIDITPLQYLENLKILIVETCQLISITQFRTLINLQQLYLAFNRVCDISPLELLTKLQYLKVYDNCITDFSPVQQHSNYQLYDIRNQKIPTAKELIISKKIQIVDGINLQHININRIVKQINLNFSLAVKETNLLIKQQYYNLIAFTSKIIQLFQSLNSIHYE
ncbi:Conserved_hypothetical protein [Hexamita inflata]|uniref:Uncharacterized protein n=1 Tax=Hexamita inflata TaxID=28002 RepID=A0AA86QP90_9EUKA|nr:Conserved hypothetical protein [Hexamita inflata]